MKFCQKPYFGPETCEMCPKVVIWTCPDLSRRTSTYFKTAEILLFFWILHLSFFYDQYLLQNSGNTSFFFEILHLPLYLHAWNLQPTTSHYIRRVGRPRKEWATTVLQAAHQRNTTQQDLRQLASNPKEWEQCIQKG